jgi:transcriptional regulator with XRE-family HTH domain
MDKTRKLLGARIKELRRLRGLSQEKLAEMISIDPKHLSRIEVGRSFPSMDTLAGMAKSLRVELKDLFEFTHQKKSSLEITKDISKLLKEADSEKLRLILKVVRSIVR